jgi:general secretion pathway protein L
MTTLGELFNSEVDFDALATLARQGFDWWIDELRAMLPDAWRARLTSGPNVWAELRPDGAWRYWKDGRQVQTDRPARDARVGLLLPPRAVLIREITTPRMPTSDVRRMVALDIDRLSPLAPSLIYFDMEIANRDAAEGQKVLLGIVPREIADGVWSAARAEGITPVALGALNDTDPPVRRFNFLPAVLAAAGQTDPGRLRRYGWGAVGALLILNFAVLVGRDIASVQRLQDLVDAQGSTVRAVQALRRRVEAEDARRRDFLARAQRAEPLRIINDLTEALPSDIWVQRLEWNGQTLHIAGFRGAATDVAAAVRGTGDFTNPRAMSNPPTTRSDQSRPFDITADARPATRP